MTYKNAVLIIALILLSTIPAMSQVKNMDSEIQLLSSSPHFSIRGLSVVSDSVLWVSGSGGRVGISTNGGETWLWRQVEGADGLDFRSLCAFDTHSAVIVSAGSPATIYRTDDQGLHWEKVYENKDEACFLDGVTFWNENQGLVYGDPVNGRFVILMTWDGGRHWTMPPYENRPRAKQGEASFAASGTAIFSLPSGKVWIGTGGTVARVFFSNNYGDTWDTYPTPVIQGESSTGIFSLAFRDGKHGIIVGGNYKQAADRKNNAFLTADGANTWKKPDNNPFGYRSCVIYLHQDTLVATGKGGSDFSVDGGRTWKSLSLQGFYVVQKARSGGAVFLAGSEGRVARLTGFPQK